MSTSITPSEGINELVETPASARAFILQRNRAFDSRRRWAFIKRLAAFIRSITK